VSAAHTGAPRPGVVIAALLTVQVLFGLQYVVLKRPLTEGMDPLEWAVVRAVVATGCLWAGVAAFRVPVPRGRRDWGALAGCAVLGMVVNQVCFVVGLSYTTSAQSALINVTIPVSALVFAWVLRTERPDPLRGIGVALAAGGVALLLSGNLQADWRLGNLYTFVNALSFGLFLVASRTVYRRVHPFAGTAVMFLFGTGIIVALVGGAWVLGWWAPRTPWGALSPTAWAALAYAIGASTVGTYALNAFALRHADSSVVGFFIFLQPLVATSVSWALGGERLTWAFGAAAALVGVGVVLVLGWPRARTAPAAPAPAVTK